MVVEHSYGVFSSASMPCRTWLRGQNWRTQTPINILKKLPQSPRRSCLKKRWKTPKVTLKSIPLIYPLLSPVSPIQAVFFNMSASHMLACLFGPSDGANSLGNQLELLPAYSTIALTTESEEEEDPWSLPELQDTGIQWSGKARSSENGWPSFPFLQVVPSSLSFLLVGCSTPGKEIEKAIQVGFCFVLEGIAFFHSWPQHSVFSVLFLCLESKWGHDTPPQNQW